MDGPTRLRIFLGSFLVVFALVASMALVSLMVVDPESSETGGNTGPTPSGNFQPDQPSEQEGEEEPEEETKKKSPCKAGRSITKSSAIVTTVMSLLLWILAVWWRQARQTRAFNGWAIAAIVFTLLAITLFFSWYIVDKICSLKVTDLDTCREIAANLLATFIGFLVPTIGFLGFAIYRKTQGHAFLGLWSGAGFVFLYITIMALSGHLVADDICDKYFKQPDIDLGNEPGEPGNDPGDPGSDPSDPGDPDNDPGNTGSDPGTSPGRGGGSNAQPGSGQNAGGPQLVGVPQVSPVALLVIMGVAAVVVIIVLALRGGPRAGGMGRAGMPAVEDRAQLLALMGRTDLKSRDKVVAAYRTFLSWTAMRGIEKQPTETPHEHARRAISDLDLPAPETLDLAHAYSQTRLGHTEPPTSLRDRVIAWVRRIDKIDPSWRE